MNASEAATRRSTARTTPSSSVSCKQKIVDRIARKCKLRKHGESRRLLMQTCQHGNDRLRIGERIGERHAVVHAATRAKPCR